MEPAGTAGTSDSATVTPSNAAQAAARAAAAPKVAAVVAAAPVTAIRTPVVLPPLPDVKGMRCLIVDDEPSNRRLCARMLQRLDCKSVLLTDGDEVRQAPLAFMCK